MSAENQGGKVPPITSGNIKKICKKYGFTYEPVMQESDNGGEKARLHVVKLGEEAVPVSFDDKGILSGKRRHKFLEVARRLSEEFRSDYPPASPYPRTRNLSSAASSNVPRPPLESGLFKQYSLAELEEAIAALDAAVAEKKREEEYRAKVQEAEETVDKLQKIAEHSQEFGIKRVPRLKSVLKEAQAKLAELKGLGETK